MEPDSDDIAGCKKKLSQFRIKELKDVLTGVGLSKQGKKQDLVDRIVALLYDEGTPGLFKNNVNGKEGLVEIINDVYRKMQETGVSDSSAKKQNASGGSRMQPKEESEESYQLERKIRCPCGGTSPCSSPLIQCVDPDCNVWQHSDCVIIPENPIDQISIPSQFLCEVCRLKRADPFWTTVAHPLYPVKLKSTIPIDGTKPTQSVDTTFKITRADRDLVRKADYDVQAWCILFNDSVQFRLQWPQYADLQVNGIPVRVVTRPGSQLLGTNGRDDGAIITLNTAEGVNKISLSGSDARIFCFGIRLVRKRTLQQVLGMIPTESHGEPFEEALARVQRCVGGGMTTDNNDSDSDLEVITDSITVNLRCPMSGSRMKMAGRFSSCVHMGCFDLETFVGLNERSRKWQCPICLKNYCLEDIVIDPFFNRIVKMMHTCGDEITEINMKPDGSWQVKNARQIGDLGQWHRPDGSLELLVGTEIGHGSLLEHNTSKLDIHNNAEGPQGVYHSFLNQQGEVECDQKHIITMSSTTSGNGPDDDETSINQNDGEQFGIHNGYENEVISVLHCFERHEIDGQNSTHLPAHADVIILSDSEDDVSLVDPVRVPLNCDADHDEFKFRSPRKILTSSPTVTSDEGPRVFSGNNDGLTNSQYPFLSPSQGGSGVASLGNSGGLLDERNCVDASESTLDPVLRVMDLNEHDHSLYDDQFVSVNGDIHSEIPVPYPSVPRNELPRDITGFCDDIVPAREGDNVVEGSRSNVGAQDEPASKNLLDLQNSFMSDEDSLIQKTNDESACGSHLTANAKSLDGPFSFPRHRRSARKRTYHKAFSGPPEQVQFSSTLE